MKKILLVLLVVASFFSLTGCGGSEVDGEGSAELEGSLEEIMLQIYEGSDVDINLDALMNTPITAENSAGYLGVDDIEFEEGLASEPEMMGGAAHSICLLKVPEGSDIESIKSRIKENVDGFKWVCVGVPD